MDAAARSGWWPSGLLAAAVLLVGAVAAFSGSPIDALAVVPFALVAISLGTHRYFGVDAILGMAARLRPKRPRAPANQAGTGLEARVLEALLLLAGNRSLRAPPVLG